MRPTRRVPAVGDHGEIVFLAATQIGEVVALEAASITVRAGDGEEIVFELNRLTGHWVRRGEPYWGTRFRLLAPED